MKPWFFAAGIETLITLLIFVGLSVLSSWLKNRNAAQGADDTPPPPRIPRRGQPGRPSPRTPERKPSSWEEELRRMLEGESPTVPPPQPIRTERHAPVPPPLPPVTKTPPSVASRRRTVAKAGESVEDGGLAMDLPALPRAASTRASAAQVDDRVGERLRQSGTFSAANASFDRASHLHELTAARMRPVAGQTSAMVEAKAQERRGAQSARVKAMLRNPETIRTAIVASIILGPPKAAES